MATKYKQLVIDGVIGDIYDSAAVHEDEVIEVVLSVLDSPIIRTALLNIYHPIGSYYFTDSDTNPGTYLGGEWETVEGRVLLGVSSKYPVNSTGGYEDAALVEHKHSYNGTTSSDNEHSHSFGFTIGGGGHEHVYDAVRYVGGRLQAANGNYYGHQSGAWGTSGGGGHTHSYSGSTGVQEAHSHSISGETSEVGVSGAGKNMMPYKAAYIWVRVA